MMILSQALSLNHFLIQINGFAIFPTAYLVFGFFVFMAFETIFAIMAGDDPPPVNALFVNFAIAFAKTLYGPFPEVFNMGSPINSPNGV
jgi:hypothetical protein